MSESKFNGKLSQSLKALLRKNLEWIEQEQARLLQDSPFATAGQAEIRLFAALRGESRTIAELSRYLGISRQAAHQTVHKLIGHGVVELKPMENNRREKLFVITERGEMARALTAKHFRKIEAKAAKAIGKSELEQLMRLLQLNLEINEDSSGH